MTLFSWMNAPLYAGEMWKRCPLVDRENGNLSITRCGAAVMLWCWCDVTHHAGEFSWASVAVLAVIAVVMLAKSIADLKAGFGAVGQIFRRRTTDSYRRVDETPAGGPPPHGGGIL